MAVRAIRLFGDPVLRTPAEPVTTFDKELRRLVADLTDTMRAAPGAGLAAPQLGVSLRVFSYDVGGVFGHLVNPGLDLLGEDEEDDEEGCLSFPGLTYNVVRRRQVIARGQNMYGDPVAIEGTDLMARCLQHETDHLDGVLFLDRMDRETRAAAMRVLSNADWAGGQPPTVKVSPHPLFGLAR